MAMNDSEVSNGRVLAMFMAIKAAEMKNVRTLQYESKDMVARITSYIVKGVDAAASSSKEAVDE